MVTEAKRYFTVDEVNELLPDAINTFHTLVQVRLQILQIQSELARYGVEEDTVDFECIVPLMRGRVRSLLSTLDVLVGAFRSQAEILEATGCQIKDMDPPLADWPALHEGREVLLCWRYGEKEIAYWHETGGGFAGRRPVSELRSESSSPSPETKDQ